MNINSRRIAQSSANKKMYPISTNRYFRRYCILFILLSVLIYGVTSYRLLSEWKKIFFWSLYVRCMYIQHTYLFRECMQKEFKIYLSKEHKYYSSIFMAGFVFMGGFAMYGQQYLHCKQREIRMSCFIKTYSECIFKSFYIL